MARSPGVSNNPAMELIDWVATYYPMSDPDGNLIYYDVVEDVSFIESLDECLVWTEIWNFDSELPLLYPGVIADENGGLRWFVCNKPWSGNSGDLIVFLEIEDWDS